jgi:hypothetical protein
VLTSNRPAKSWLAPAVQLLPTKLLHPQLLCLLPIWITLSVRPSCRRAQEIEPGYCVPLYLIALTHINKGGCCQACLISLVAAVVVMQACTRD